MGRWLFQSFFNVASQPRRACRNLGCILGFMALTGCAPIVPDAPAPSVPVTRSDAADSPDVPTPIGPGADARSIVANTRPMLRWHAAANATAYGVYLSQHDGQEWRLLYDSEVEYAGPLVATELRLPPDLLQDGGRYRWNVRGWNDRSGWGPFSKRLEFVVDGAALGAVSDEELHRLVSQRLNDTEGLDTFHLKLGVREREVSLIGCVPDQDQHERIRAIVQSVPGVVNATAEKLRIC